MGLFSRLFGRSRRINVLVPVDVATGRYALTQEVRIKWRPSQTVPPALRDEIVAAWRDDGAVRSASILDVLEQPTGATKIFLTLGLDNPGEDFHRVGPRLREAFDRYPELRNRFLIGADLVREVPREMATYQRAR